jgi:sec-independent protein translocase protein TatA
MAGRAEKSPFAAEDLQMGSLSIWHWIIVLLVVMVLFGGRGKISSLMGDFAQGIKAFKKGMSEDEKTADTKSEPVKTIEAGGSATKTEAERRAEGAFLIAATARRSSRRG